MRPTITICMGSSCFARGNGKLLDVIESFLAKRGLADRVDLVGSRCEENCRSAPNLRINGTLYPHMDRGTLIDLLEEHFGAGMETDG